ncbi:MAG: Holliday junction resolvase RuvX [Geminicoccaceae bacterium]
MVTPLFTLVRKGWLSDVDRLRAIVSERKITGLIVGYPLRLDGSAGPAAQSRRDLARKFSVELMLPHLLQDESLSTEAVRDAIKEGRLPPVRRGEPEDHYAAAIVLADALSALEVCGEPNSKRPF